MIHTHEVESSNLSLGTNIFIKFMKNIRSYLEESLLKHIALEFKNNDIIYEKYGEYDGCEELSEYIYQKLKDNDFKSIEINYEEVKNIDNIVFDKLFIMFKESDDIKLSYFVPENSEESISLLKKFNIDANPDNYSSIDNKTNRFNKCLIYIQYPKTRNKSMINKLNHELNHMFADYNIQIKGLTSFLEIFSNDAYKRTKEYNQHKHPLRASQLENALYLMNEYEKNAFISQLCSEIRELKESDKYYRDGKLDANKVYYMVQQLDIYQAYMNIANFINDYDNNALTKKEKEDIISEWNKIYHEDLPLDQIFKKLKSKFIRTKQKIESIIPKKIAEEYGLYNNAVIMDEGINLSNPSIII